MIKLKNTLYTFIWLNDECSISRAVQYSLRLKSILEISKTNLEKAISFYKL